MLTSSLSIRRPSAADGPLWAQFLAHVQATTYRDLIGPEFGEQQRAAASSYGAELTRAFADQTRAERRIAIRSDGQVMAIAAAGPAPEEWETSAGFVPAPADWQLTKLYVHPQAQGTGLADQLLAEVLPEGRATYLWIIQGNERAHRFYTRRGFADLDETFPAGAGWGGVPMRRMLRAG